MSEEVQISDDTLSKVFAAIATSTKSLKTIHKELKIDCCFQTLWKKLNSTQALIDQYTRAKEQQADLMAEEIIEIADTETDQYRSKNRIDARKWTASKLKPKSWGDKVEHKHELGDNVSRIIIETAEATKTTNYCEKKEQ